MLICNEETDPVLARRLATKVGKDPAVDFLVNISNDGWFDGSSEHAEHLAISRFRAVETRRALARAVNMGISAIIDSNGRVLQPTERPAFGDGKIWAVPESQRNTNGLPEEKWRDFTKVHGILAARIPIDDRVSLYALTGDWLPVGCWLILGGVWGWRKYRRFAFGIADDKRTLNEEVPNEMAMADISSPGPLLSGSLPGALAFGKQAALPPAQSTGRLATRSNRRNT